MCTRILIATLLALALAPLARADGLPISDAGAPATIGLDGLDGRYVALPTERGTVVARIGDAVYASRLLDGRYTVPVVALDQTSSGLSADGTTLVLISPRRTFPRAKTSFAVLGTKHLRMRTHIVLDGDFSFDALSPDGTRIFLIHYLSRRDPTHYEVRALDVPIGKLLPTPIVDKSEPDERMAGFPVTRKTSAEGRWAYTLYDGAGAAPFLHALDTVNGEAHCIDLDMLAGRRNLYDLRLGLGDAGRLTVLDGARTVALIDTTDFAPVDQHTPVPQAAQAEEPQSTTWPLGLLAAALLAVVGAAVFLVIRGRRYGSRSTVPSRPRT